MASTRWLEKDAAWGLGGIIAGALLVPMGILTIWSRRRTQPVPTELSSVRDETYQVPTYLVTFVLPFLFIELKSAETIAAYAILILFVAAILTRSDISIVNPGLLLLNYRMFDAVRSDGKGLTIIAKSAPQVSRFNNLRHVSGQVYMLEKEKR